MKRTVCLIIAVLVLSTFVLPFSSNAESLSFKPDNPISYNEEKAILYGMTGYPYGPGISRVSYNVAADTITITGPTGVLMTAYVTGSGYLEFSTQSGNTYTCTATTVKGNSWISY